MNSLKDRLNPAHKDLKQFEHALVKKYDIQCIEKEGKRFYNICLGYNDRYDDFDYVLYKSVTTILKEKSDQTKLDEWRERVGQEEADKISFQATVRGNSIHAMAEKLLMNDPEYWKGEGTLNIQNFNRMVPVLNTYISKVYGLEVPLWSHKLKTAGRSDVICVWDGENSIVDFKTARKKKYKKYIEHYFIQAAVYAIMFEELYKIEVPRIVVIVLVDASGESTVYLEKTKNWLGKIDEYFGQLGEESF